jgi:hypothetical protein
MQDGVENVKIYHPIFSKLQICLFSLVFLYFG